VDLLWRQRQIKRPIFSFILYDYDDNANESYMILGGIDDSMFYGSLHWLPVSDPTFWALQVTHVGFGDTFGRATGKAIIDSGTSYILCPKHQLNGIHAMIGATRKNAYYTVPCEKISGMPTFTIVFDDDLEVPLYPEDYTYTLYDECYSNFMPLEREDDVRNNKKPDWIFGAAFLRSFYVAFDMEESRVGIARFRHR
jgi:hypothetical protein